MNKESLEWVDKVYEEAVTGFDQAKEAVHTAQIQESLAGEARETAYNKALKSGLVIEKVLDPSEISYLAGYKEQWANLFEADDDEAVWLALDDSHAEALEGVHAEAQVRQYPYYRSLDRATHQPYMKLRLKVPAILDNEQVGTGVHRPDWQEENITEYAGKLEAIEWRLPTDEEIQQYAGSAAVAAA